MLTDNQLQKLYNLTENLSLEQLENLIYDLQEDLTYREENP